jgi:hypothetical protein
VIEAAWLIVKGFVGKIPAGVWKALGAVAVGLAFLWVAYSAGADDAKDKAAVKEAKALAAQAERYAEEMGRVAAVIAQVSAEVSTTQVRSSREVSNARREIERQPGAGAVVDAGAWAAARASIERLRGDGASDNPPRGGSAPAERP